MIVLRRLIGSWLIFLGLVIVDDDWIDSHIVDPALRGLGVER